MLSVSVCSPIQVSIQGRIQGTGPEGFDFQWNPQGRINENGEEMEQMQGGLYQGCRTLSATDAWVKNALEVSQAQDLEAIKSRIQQGCRIPTDCQG